MKRQTRKRRNGKNRGGSEKDILRPPGIRKVLMIRRDIFLEIGIRFHRHDIVNAGKNGLDEAVVVHDVCELGVEDVGHEGAGG